MQLKVFTSSGKRSCGECSACCTICAVEELGKPTHTHCIHQADAGGCLIYNDRPASCAAYSCLWLGGYLPDQFRPDRSGIVWAYFPIRPGVSLLQACLTTTEVPLEKIKYQMNKLYKEIGRRIPVQILPANVKLRPNARFHSVDLEPGIFLVDRELTDEEAQQLPGKEAPGTLKR